MSEDEWKPLFENQVELRKDIAENVGKGNLDLKFDLSYIKVSDIADQFYCESKVEMNYMYGVVETEEKKEGTDLHEEMTKDAVVVEFEELMKKIYEEEECIILETMFIIKYKDNYIVGKPDMVVFRRGIPIFLFDYKFSKYQTTFRDQHVQARTYCLILNEMGFNTDLLFYGIIVAPREMKEESSLVRYIPKKIIKELDIKKLIQENEKYLPFDNVNVYLHKFDPKQGENDLDWAIQYWKGIRSAEPTKNENKCRVCEHKEECEYYFSK